MVGSDTVTFRLEDGTLVKVKVDLASAAVAEDLLPNETQKPYQVKVGTLVKFVPKDRKIKLRNVKPASAGVNDDRRFA